MRYGTTAAAALLALALAAGGCQGSGNDESDGEEGSAGQHDAATPGSAATPSVPPDGPGAQGSTAQEMDAGAGGQPHVGGARPDSTTAGDGSGTAPP